MKNNLYYTTDVDAAEKEFAALKGRITQILTDHLVIAHLPEGTDSAKLEHASLSLPPGLDDDSKLFVKAYQSMSNGAPAVSQTESVAKPQKSPALLGAPHLQVTPPSTSYYMIGKIAVSTIIVQGPTSTLKFSDAEKTQVRTCTMNALNRLIELEGHDRITWDHRLARDINITALPLTDKCTATNYSACEDVWLTPTLAQLGVPDILQYNKDVVNNQIVIKDNPGMMIKWAYTIFFTKYPSFYYAYTKSTQGGVVIPYQNFSGNPSGLTGTLTHETCHVFGAADEYSRAGYQECTCNASGYYNVPNYNCTTCNDFNGPKQTCLMETSGTSALCSWSRGQIGWNFTQLSNVFKSGQFSHPKTRTFSFEYNKKTYLFAYSPKDWSVSTLNENGPGTQVAGGLAKMDLNIIVPYQDRDFDPNRTQPNATYLFVQYMDKNWFIAKAPLTGNTLVPLCSGESNSLYRSAFSFNTGSYNDPYLFVFEDAGNSPTKYPWSISLVAKKSGSSMPGRLEQTAQGFFNHLYDVSFPYSSKKDVFSSTYPYMYAQTFTDRKWFVAKLTADGASINENDYTGRFNALYSLSAPFTVVNNSQEEAYMFGLDTRVYNVGPDEEQPPNWIIVQLTGTGDRLGTILGEGRLEATALMLYPLGNKNYMLKQEATKYSASWETMQVVAGAGAIFK